MSTQTEQAEEIRVDCSWCRRKDVLVWYGTLYPHSDPANGELCPARGQTPEGAAEMAALHEQIRHQGHP